MHVYCFGDEHHKPEARAECSVDGLEQSRVGLSPAVQRIILNRIGQMGFALETNVDRTFTVLKC
jgi:hypothetical protein